MIPFLAIVGAVALVAALAVACCFGAAIVVVLLEYHGPSRVCEADEWARRIGRGPLKRATRLVFFRRCGLFWLRIERDS